MQGGGGTAEQVISRTPRQLALTASPKASVWMALSAFTMAEILLSLTIIGVVAAITLPSLTGNINERTWNTQRKALYARLSQAIPLMGSINGYGTLDDTSDNVAETFITAGLSKVLKINNICDNSNLKDCGLPEKMTPFAGSVIDFPKTLASLNIANTSVYESATGQSYSQLDTKAAAFETANGESIAVYYNPECTSFLAETAMIYSQKKMCANFVYDLNGSKGPNTFGKDIGIITVFYPTDSLIVAPMPHTQDAGDSVASNAVSGKCKTQDEDYRMPSKEELAALFVNRNLVGNMGKPRYWSSSLSSSITDAWYVQFDKGLINHDPRLDGHAVRCIKR